MEPYDNTFMPSCVMCITWLHPPPLQQCGKLKSCEKMGLHAHHPRDCLFRLRDFDVEELQRFLRENNVEFDVDPPREQVKAARRKMKQDKDGGEVDGAEDEGEYIFEQVSGGVTKRVHTTVLTQRCHCHCYHSPLNILMSLLVYYVDDGGGANDAEVKLECTVMLQKEQPEGLIDAECGTLVAKGHAGLCKYVGEGRRGGRGGGGGRETEHTLS